MRSGAVSTGPVCLPPLLLPLLLLMMMMLLVLPVLSSSLTEPLSDDEEDSLGATDREAGSGSRPALDDEDLDDLFAKVPDDVIIRCYNCTGLSGETGCNMTLLMYNPHDHITNCNGHCINISAGNTVVFECQRDLSVRKPWCLQKAEMRMCVCGTDLCNGPALPLALKTLPASTQFPPPDNTSLHVLIPTAAALPGTLQPPSSQTASSDYARTVSGILLKMKRPVNQGLNDTHAVLSNETVTMETVTTRDTVIGVTETEEEIAFNKIETAKEADPKEVETERDIVTKETKTARSAVVKETVTPARAVTMKTISGGSRAFNTIDMTFSVIATVIFVSFICSTPR